MPGPDFENSSGSSKEWFRQHSQKIVLSLIVVLLAVGGFYFYKNYQEHQNLLDPAIQGLQSTPSQNPVSPSPETKITTPQKTEVQTPVVQKQENKIMVKAAKGNGATHLARQALKEYLKDKSFVNSKLTPERKVYIEDYLQKHVAHDNVLHAGDEFSFSDELILNAINKSLELSDPQLKNLSKYAVKVPSLNY